MSGYDREAAEAEAREAAERDRLPSEYTLLVLRATASRMQSRIDAILERDKDERVAIEGRGAGISFLFARDIVHALTAGHDEIERLRAELAVLRTPATDEALVEVVAQAICAVSCSATRRDGSGCECWDWQANELEARAVLAAAGPALVARERERIAKGLAGEADLVPCSEDASVYRSAAWLVRGDFSYEEAERLEIEAENIAAIRTGAPDAR